MLLTVSHSLEMLTRLPDLLACAGDLVGPGLPYSLAGDTRVGPARLTGLPALFRSMGSLEARWREVAEIAVLPGLPCACNSLEVVVESTENGLWVPRRVRSSMKRGRRGRRCTDQFLTFVRRSESTVRRDDCPVVGRPGGLAEGGAGHSLLHIQIGYEVTTPRTSLKL